MDPIADPEHPEFSALLSFHYSKTEEVIGVTEPLTLNFAIDQANTSGQYYAFAGYAFQVTPTGAGFTVKVLAMGNGMSGTVTVNGTPVTTVGQEITISVP